MTDYFKTNDTLGTGVNIKEISITSLEPPGETIMDIYERQARMYDHLAELQREIGFLHQALAMIYQAHEKALDSGDAWFITDDTTVGAYICSILGKPPEPIS